MRTNTKSDYSFTMLIVFFIASILGVLSISLLNIQLSPSNSLPSVNVSYYWGNAPPEIIEREITSRLEGAFSTLEGIKKIRSTSKSGYGRIDLSIDKHTDMDQIRFEISVILRQIFPQFPDGVSFPQIHINRPDDDSNAPLLIYSLSGNENSAKLQEYANEIIKKDIASINGIQLIDVYGGSPFFIDIIYNSKALDALDISENDIIAALHNHFDRRNLGIANLQSDTAAFSNFINVKIKNTLDSIIDWKHIAIKKADNRIVFLGDIAKIRYSQKQASSYYRINNLNAIYLVIHPEKGVNQIKTAQAVKERIQSLSTHLPKSYHLTLNNDSTEYIQNELSKIYWRTLFTIIILLLFVAVISRSIKYLLAIIASLAVNIAICFFLYTLLGVEIHIYSLAGITISLGLIIDNSIIMIDHIRNSNHIRIFIAILASTLKTTASLSIIFLLPESLKLDLKDFALIIMINLLVSLFVALFFIPALISKIGFAKRMKHHSQLRIKIIRILNNWYSIVIGLLIRFRVIVIIIAILGFGLPTYLLPTKLNDENSMAKIYNKTLGSNWYTENAMPIVNKVLGGSLRLFANFVYEKSSYREPEKTMLYVYASMSRECTASQMNEVILDIEHFLSQYVEIDKYVSRIRGVHAEISISFKEGYEKSHFPYLLKGKLIRKSIDKGGISWSVFGVGEGFHQSAEISESTNYSISMYGFNYDELNHQVQILKEKLLKHPRVKEVKTDGSEQYWVDKSLFEYVIVPDRYLLKQSDNSLIAIYSEIAQKDLYVPSILNIVNNRKSEQIQLRSDNNTKFGLWQMLNEPMASLNNKPIGVFSSIGKEKVSSTILKEDQQYLRAVRFDYLGNSKFGNKYRDKIIEEMNKELPLGYYVKQSSYSWGREASKQYYLILIIMLLIYMICSILFESLYQPLAIIFIIPLSYIGVFLTFYCFDFNFDQGGYPAFVLLSGLVVNASIYIINEYNNIRKQYSNRTIPLTKLYIKAFNAKIIPILLTIISTILGLTPFVFLGQDEPFWFALAVGSIGGLIFSVIAIVFILPILVISRKQYLKYSQ